GTWISKVFDPASGTWTRAADMNAARGWHTATLLPDGHVLVAGGVTGPVYWVGTPLASAELFDVAKPRGTGTACTTPLDCQSGFCTGGVCGARAWPGGACAEVLGAPTDGTCMPLLPPLLLPLPPLLLLPECAPFVFSEETGACTTSCSTVSDCAPGFAC